MNVIFISECQKKALNRTRKVLDAYANRIGGNAWQTAITEEGLAMVKKLLRQSASKNTAVSCHRIATRNRTELVWMVGNKDKFNEQGFVPVNRTKRNILKSDWQNNWQSLNTMLIVSTLSALLHDLGKSSVGFQNKLTKSAKTGDPYRHEWISLKLFLWLIQDCQTDNEVFERLCQIDTYLTKTPFHSQDMIGQIERTQMDKLPPIAGWIAWLIATHHRLPALTEYHFKDKQKYLDVNNRYLKVDLNTYYKSLFKPLDGWVKNVNSNAKLDEFYQFNHIVWHSPAWQKQLKRYAKKAQNDPVLQSLSLQKKPVVNPFLTLLSRLSLMVGDHNYSSLAKHDKACVAGSPEWAEILIANTDRKTGKSKQALDEHLLGVADLTAKFCHRLPILHEHLPTLKQHEPLQRNTASERFLWQNYAVKLAKSQSENSQTHGFFGVNMASTGCGKTIGNARLMYALANANQGARLTIALGLRVLTLQTGQSFRKNLALSDSQLAILVGGVAQKQLFGLNQERPETGSESDECLLDEWVDGDDFDGVLTDLNLGTVVADKPAQNLLISPVVTCTIDHLMQASECGRGGRYIVPLLRLLSSDLILDEPDDFDQQDLPALSRLVYLAGLFGSRVLLSSATLPPDMVQGLFNAYLAGRKIYNAQFDKPTPCVVCAWFDENDCTTHLCDTSEVFARQHQIFVKKRCQFLDKQLIKHKAEILPLAVEFNGEKQGEFYQTLAQNLLSHAQKLHRNHHISFDNQSISIGLMRMANIQPLMKLAHAIHQLSHLEDGDDTQIHLCVYHSQQILALRNRLEVRLDALLSRKNKNNQSFINQPDIKNAVCQYPNKKYHIFIVLATAVSEVGRDHDYDWAIVEPSSVRSIVQLAGRVWRHRPDLQADTPNIAIWQKNIRALMGQNICFTKPGFESKTHTLATHDINELILSSTLNKLDACPRIAKSLNLNPDNNLADLEQVAIADLMNNQGVNVVNAYFMNENTASRHHVHLSLLTPFRAGRANVDFVVKPCDDEMQFYDATLVAEQGFSKRASEIYHKIIKTSSPFVSVWLDTSLADELALLAQSLPEISYNTIIKRFATVSLNEYQQGYWFDERFGFWRKE